MVSNDSLLFSTEFPPLSFALHSFSSLLLTALLPWRRCRTDYFTQALRDLKISTVKPSILAASFDSGSVVAWSTVAKSNAAPIAEFSGVHQSPATCLALSPITDMLMVSGGLDKSIVLYDIPKKKSALFISVRPHLLNQFRKPCFIISLFCVIDLNQVDLRNVPRPASFFIP